MKYLLVLVVVMVAFYIWRNNRLEDHRSNTARKAPPAKGLAPSIMVACRQCGTHLPENEAVQGRQGVYCSAEHRHLLEG